MDKRRKLFFISPGKLSGNSSHSARLRYELNDISKIADVSILSLANELDKSFTAKYPNIKFYVLPIKFNGWKVVNLTNTIKQIIEIISLCNPDIVILCVEIWDLIIKLQKKIFGKTAFCTICHALPFLCSPFKPTKSFESDVRKFADRQEFKYRKDYILKHYTELYNVMNSGILIANNATVAYYLKHYFPKSFFWKQVPHVTVNAFQTSKTLDMDYDFCYMARMEKGKGVEYLQELFKEISAKLGRKIRVAIMGRADDEYSEKKLRQLLANNNDIFSIHFFGWADDRMKCKVLSRSGCFIYPSIYDNFPTVVNEAMAYGLPVAMWDTLYYRINYSDIRSVSVATPFNIEKLASVSVDLLNRRLIISHYSTDYIKKNGRSKLVAKNDLRLFNEIIRFYERNKQ